MQKWQIRYWHDESDKNLVEKWLDDLKKEELESVAKELKLLALNGNQLKLPHSRAIGKGIFELRERRYGYRIYYGFYKMRTIFLLASGNKSTQKRDIKIARQRLAKLDIKRGEHERQKFSKLS